MIDAVNQLFASFPMVLGITAAVIFVVITLAFRSILAPLRLLIEVLLIQVFYLGVNVCIFQYGHAMGDDSLLWATIFMMVMISIGLSCDYDIFSFNGIYRHYYDNYEQAIKNGVKINFTDSIMATGDNLLIVMCAGLIMMVSFSGLLFSSLDMLLQFGSCLVFDLFFNTFIVVPILVPTFSHAFGEISMFPGNVLEKKRIGKETDETMQLDEAEEQNLE